MFKKERKFSVAPTPVSLDASTGTTRFTEWSIQGKVDGTHIRGLYVPIELISKGNLDELLWEVATLDGGADIGFILFMEYKEGALRPYIVMLNSLQLGPCDDGGNVYTYVWISETVYG